MSKFCELAADKVLKPKDETMLFTHTVSDPNWLYMPKFILIRRVAQMGGFSSVPDPSSARVDLSDLRVVPS